MFANLIAPVATLLAAIVLIPYRLYARMTERGIETARDGGWNTGFGDQQRLNMATDMALRQAVTFNAVPLAGARAVRAVSALGY